MCLLSRHTTSISPPLRPRKLRNRILYPLHLRNRHASFSPRAPRLRWPDLDDFAQGKKRLRHWFERPAMDRARAEFMELQKMQFRSVTFVLAETILWNLAAKVTHEPVARDLRDHACRGDAQADAVAIDNCRLRKRKRNHW